MMKKGTGLRILKILNSTIILVSIFVIIYLVVIEPRQITIPEREYYWPLSNNPMGADEIQEFEMAIAIHGLHENGAEWNDEKFEFGFWREQWCPLFRSIEID